MRIAILAYNAVEWLEIYAATAKAGLVMVPINFRLVGSEIAYIVENSEAKACIVQADLVDRIDGIPRRSRDRGGALHPLRRHRRAEGIQGLRGPDRLGLVGRAGGRCEARGAVGADVHLGHHGQAQGRHAQPWQPCGAQPRHLADLGFGRADTAMLVMPMCHANSLFFASAFAYAGATCCVYDRRSFDPEHCCARWPRRGRRSPRWCRRTTS